MQFVNDYHCMGPGRWRKAQSELVTEENLMKHDHRRLRRSLRGTPNRDSGETPGLAELVAVAILCKHSQESNFQKVCLERVTSQELRTIVDALQRHHSTDSRKNSTLTSGLFCVGRITRLDMRGTNTHRCDYPGSGFLQQKATRGESQGATEDTQHGALLIKWI